MKQSSKHREQESHTETAEAVQKQEAREFANVEELLREDAAHVEVPESVKTRLEDSIAQEMPPKSGPWWKKLFGG
jgi:hypothetical protein